MDEKPFLRLDVSDVGPKALPELQKMTKATFDLFNEDEQEERITLESAVDLYKYADRIREAARRYR